MILLGIPPLPRLQYLSDNTSLPPLLVHFLRHLSGFLFLLGVVVEDGAAVLGACVWALTVRSGGVVHLVEEFEEGAVGDLGGVVVDLEGFGVCNNSY
jgi:hypothetical protein